MNKQAIEKSAKAKRIAELILEHIDGWMEQLSKYQQSDLAFKDYGRIQWNGVEAEELNRLVEKFTEIIEREL